MDLSEKNIGFSTQEPNFAWKDSRSKVHVSWLSNMASIQGIFLVMKFSLNSIKFFENIELEAFSRCLINRIRRQGPPSSSSKPYWNWSLMHLRVHSACMSLHCVKLELHQASKLWFEKFWHDQQTWYLRAKIGWAFEIREPSLLIQALIFRYYHALLYFLSWSKKVVAPCGLNWNYISIAKRDAMEADAARDLQQIFKGW